MTDLEAPFKTVNLESPVGCLQEIQDCSQGIAFLDHYFSRIVDELVDAELDYDRVEAAALDGARRSSSDTAAEIKARVTEAVETNAEWRKARDRLVKAKTSKTKLDRYLRSLEKRMSGAQSAQKGHELIQRGGGAA